VQTHVSAKSLADVALDTLPYNGHTTAADTLWAGVPLITLPGDRMCSRAGASLARAIGPSALAFVARDTHDYAALAAQAARGKRGGSRVLRSARARLEEAVWGAAGETTMAGGGPFDVGEWVRGWERALALVWDARVASGPVVLDAPLPHLVTARLST